MDSTMRGEDNVLKIIMGFIALSMPDDFGYKLVNIPSVNALIYDKIGESVQRLYGI